MTKKAETEKNVVHSIKDTLESLVIAFILAFVFRAFVVEAFVIPTGSMADTLRGAHFQVTCPACGYDYNYGFDTNRYGMEKGKLPSHPIPIQTVDPRFKRQNTQNPVCPMCGTPAANEKPRYVANGDRILVLKYLYQFAEPDRWDVVVFKNPWNPYENYIKRLVARPGEELRLSDGDVYIDGAIQTKPQSVQNALWIKIFDTFYQPGDNRVDPDWRQPFRPRTNASGWEIDTPNRRFAFLGGDGTGPLPFAQERLNHLTRAFCAYNGDAISPQTQCSDLKFETQIIPSAASGQFSVELGKYGRGYTGLLDFAGQCRILGPAGEVLAEQAVAPLEPGRSLAFSFALVDHTLRLAVGHAAPLIHTGPNDAAAWGYLPGQQQLPPTVAVNGQGSPFQLDSVQLYRDIHYMTQYGNNPVRGSDEEPIQLERDQFFVCGDNSPQSYDSRLWEKKGVTNDPARTHDAGIVPRDYMIGKAFFVYWPAGYRPSASSRIALIPNFGDMRFIY